MITLITERIQDFINVSIASVNAAGVRIDPTAVVATFFRVNQSNGALDLAIDVGIAGTMDLAQQADEVGFWGSGVDVSNSEPGQFVVLFEITHAGGVAVALDTFYIESWTPDVPTPGTPGPVVNGTSG